MVPSSIWVKQTSSSSDGISASRSRAQTPNAILTGILKAREMCIDAQGGLNGVRELNGDETRNGECVIMPNENPDYGGFPIAITIPAHTAIATCTAYTITE